MKHYEVQALEIALRTWTDSKYAFAKANGWMETAKRCCSLYDDESFAVMLEQLPSQIGQSFKDRNGDKVFAIIRNRQVKTIMLRRTNQDCSAEALRVDIVYQI